MISHFPSTQSNTLVPEIKAVKNLRTIFDALTSARIPNETYPASRLEVFLSSLVVSQRFGDPLIKDGFWSVRKEVADMPSDARDEFIHLPTCLAIAMLVFCKRHHTELIADPGTFDGAIRTGLDFSLGRGLGGHGMDALHARRDALVILSMGEVINLLLEMPDFHPGFGALLSQVKDEIGKTLQAEPPIRSGQEDLDDRPVLTEIAGLLEKV